VIRYVDVFPGPCVSFYNTIMKLFFIGSTAYTLYLLRVRFRWVVVSLGSSAVGHGNVDVGAKEEE